MQNDSCYEVTVEAPSDSFQLMKDNLDLKLLIDRPEFADFKHCLETPLKDARAIFDHSRKLNKDILETLNKTTKIRKAQISRVFDMILLASIDQNDSFAMSAYEGFLRKKIERLNSQSLITKVKEKYIEYEGKVVHIDYSQFASKNPESSLL